MTLIRTEGEPAGPKSTECPGFCHCIGSPNGHWNHRTSPGSGHYHRGVRWLLAGRLRRDRRSVASFAALNAVRKPARRDQARHDLSHLVLGACGSEPAAIDAPGLELSSHPNVRKPGWLASVASNVATSSMKPFCCNTIKAASLKFSLPPDPPMTSRILG